MDTDWDCGSLIKQVVRDVVSEFMSLQLKSCADKQVIYYL